MLYPKKRASDPAKAHRRFPYLFKHLTIDRPSRAWAADVTHLPMARGCLHLGAIIDWASRAVLFWRLSTTMETDFCVEALTEAIERFGTLEIFNTDQGAQFTSESPLSVLEEHKIRISMDGKGRWRECAACRGITSSSSGFGAASNTRRCISKPMKPPTRQEGVLPNTSISTTMYAVISRSTGARPGKFTPPAQPLRQLDDPSCG